MVLALSRHNAPVTRLDPRPTSPLAIAAALLIVYVVWGSTYLAIAVMIQTLPPLVAAGVRYATAGVLLLVGIGIWRRARRQPGERPSWLHWRSALIIGTLLLLGGNGGVVLAEQRIPSGIAALIVATSPIWMAILEVLVAGQRPSRLALAGLVAGAVGVGILVVPLEGVAALDPVGIGLVVGAAICWSLGSIYARRAPLPRSPFQGAGLEMVAGGTVMLGVGLLRGELSTVDPSTFSSASLLAVAYLIAFGSVVAFTAYIWLLHHASISVVSTYAYVNPVVAVALGAVVLSEPMTPRTWLASVIIIGAVVAMVSGRPRDVPEPEAAVEPTAERAA
jgi:drug/metabolite transporter (DMT)-like permease